MKNLKVPEYYWKIMLMSKTAICSIYHVTDKSPEQILTDRHLYFILEGHETLKKECLGNGLKKPNFFV